jgi:hypothetical protein
MPSPPEVTGVPFSSKLFGFAFIGSHLSLYLDTVFIRQLEAVREQPLL